jgi:serine phosphatase RsbU (regulator of sigma subunit)
MSSAGPAASEPSGERSRSGLAVGLTVVVALSVAEQVIGGRIVPITAMAVAPLLASMLGGPRDTAVVGVAATTAAVTVAADEPTLWWTAQLVVRIAFIAVIGAIAVVLARRRLQREHQLDRALQVRQLSTALQAAMLPQPRLDRTEIDVHGCYLPGERQLLLGGDFYDVVDRPNGSVAFVIGDVVGHGPGPAATAVALRAGWRALATTTTDGPGHWLRALNAAVLAEKARHNGFFVTCLVGEIHPRHRTITIASAGHPAPIEVSDAGARALPLRPKPPLGVVHHGSWAPETHPLSERWLMAYTDGLIEGRADPGAPHRIGEAGLLDWLARHGRRGLGGEALDRLITHAQAANGAPLADDVAILTFDLPAGPDR